MTPAPTLRVTWYTRSTPTFTPVAHLDAEFRATPPMVTVVNGAPDSTGVMLLTRSWLMLMNDGPATTATSNFGDTANGHEKSRWSADSVCERSPLDAVAVRGEVTNSGFGICAVTVDWPVLLNRE